MEQLFRSQASHLIIAQFDGQSRPKAPVKYNRLERERIVMVILWVRFRRFAA
jgi:hypothetical protein